MPVNKTRIYRLRLHYPITLPGIHHPARRQVHNHSTTSMSFHYLVFGFGGSCSHVRYALWPKTTGVFCRKLTRLYGNTSNGPSSRRNLLLPLRKSQTQVRPLPGTKMDQRRPTTSMPSKPCQFVLTLVASLGLLGSSFRFAGPFRPARPICPVLVACGVQRHAKYP